MPGAFSGLYMASNALRAFEMALNVTGNNLSNVNTRGFSRQTISIESTPEQGVYGLRPFRIGTGAFVGSVSRVRDMFLEARLLQSNYEGSKLDQMFSTLRGIETSFGEPSGNRISSALSSMYDSWSQLNANPNDPAARLNVRLQSELFAGRVRDVNSQLMATQAQTQQEASYAITRINALGQQISDLNAEIRTAQATGGMPNALLDQRDQMLQDLSGLVDIRTQGLSDGSITIFIDNHTLVNQTASNPLPTTYDAATSTVTNGVKSTLISGGKLAGLLGGINATDTYKTQLDTLVNGVRTQINALHATGTNPNGTTGINIFDGSVGAGDLAVNASIASDLNNLSSGVSGLPGDGSLAAAIAALRDAPSAALGNRSPVEYYNNLVATLGQNTRYYSDAAETQMAVVTQLNEQRSSISGVNADEEMANMLRFQRSFQAASKVLSVLDQTTDDLIRSFGR